MTECVDKMTLSRRSIEQQAGELSGGNQQKVVLAKLIAHDDIQIYIFDEPTRGIDVGAKYEIYQLILDLAKEEKGVIMISDFVKIGIPSIVISSEIPEIQALCDRVVIMSEGRVTAILNRDQLKDSNEILKYAIS